MLIYLDQNALIALGRKARKKQFRAKLDLILASNAMTFVVTLWHLVETANTNNIGRAVELAVFIESLRPLWLLERHDLLIAEVAEDFSRFAKIDSQKTLCTTSFSAMYAKVLRQPDGPRFQIPAANFVTQWINHPDQLRSLKAGYAQNSKSLQSLRALRNSETSLSQAKRLAELQLVGATAPTTTPSGLLISLELRADYVKHAKVASIPTLAIESAISEREWGVRDGSGTDRNTLIDKFHIISALPYVDEIVTDDHFFYETYSAARATGHVRAKLVGNAEFLERFN